MSTDRSDYTAGLRALADLLDQHPEVPLPYSGTKQSPLLIVPHENQRQVLADVARAFPGTVRKDVRDGYFDLYASVEGLHVQVIAYRSEVCERVVIGTREVTREVLDPEALAAVSRVTVTETVEDVEWICSPLLRDAVA